jgi:hypothetical protein
MSDDDLRMTTGKVRLSFPFLFKPRRREGQDPKYSVMLLIDKGDEKTIKTLRRLEAKCLKDNAASLFGIKSGEPKLGQRGLAPSIIKDGDEDGTAEDYPERAGCYYMTVNATEDFPPKIVDRNVEPIIDQSEVYSGVHARVSLQAFAYKRDEKKGISFGLGNVQVYTGEGESLGGGGRKAEDDFEAIPDEGGDESLL